MTREQAINYLLSSGMSGEQIKEVLEPFTHEEAFKKEADIIVYIKANKNFNIEYLAEHLDISLYAMAAVNYYQIHVLKGVEGDNEN